MYNTSQQFTLQPLHWVETTTTTGLKKLVAISVTNKLVIQQSAFDKTYDLDVHTECTAWNLHFGCRTIEEAKELAWKEHCKQLRNCLLPIDLFHQKELLL
mgnify:CR=1 FL=1